MTEFKLRKQDGNPVGDMDDIIAQARKELSAEDLHISFDPGDDEVTIKIKAR